MACSVQDASKLHVLWKKHMSRETRSMNVDELYTSLRREVKYVKKALHSEPSAPVTRGLLTELRNDLKIVGGLRKRCK